jgi:phosphoglycerate kinase
MCSSDIKEAGLLFDNESVLNHYSCFDIGTSTIENMKRIINDSKTLLWNGALGAFEFANFGISSYEIAKFIAEKTTSDGDFTSIIGGGETIASVGRYKDKMSFASTAGGAFLEYIAGYSIPGVSSLCTRIDHKN